jgi:hypothetical protein
LFVEERSQLRDERGVLLGKRRQPSRALFDSQGECLV